MTHSPLPHHVEPGSIFSSRYVIHGVIGEGGMATVYRALDQERGTPVAIKVLRRELARAVGAERFAREIDIASAMDHPNVVSLIDAGTSGEWLYCVMPLFEGETLRDRFKTAGDFLIASRQPDTDPRDRKRSNIPWWNWWHKQR